MVHQYCVCVWWVNVLIYLLYVFYCFVCDGGGALRAAVNPTHRTVKRCWFWPLREVARTARGCWSMPAPTRRPRARCVVGLCFSLCIPSCSFDLAVKFWAWASYDSVYIFVSISSAFTLSIIHSRHFLYLLPFCTFHISNSLTLAVFSCPSSASISTSSVLSYQHLFRSAFVVLVSFYFLF